MIRPVGVGVNLLPHATRLLAELGLEAALARAAVETAESRFYNRFGQLIYQEPLGRRAGLGWPQFSIHRADLQGALVERLREVPGGGTLELGRKCTGFEQDAHGATLAFEDGGRVRGAAAREDGGRTVPPADGADAVRVRRGSGGPPGEIVPARVNLSGRSDPWRGEMAANPDFEAFFAARHAGDVEDLVEWIRDREHS